MADALSGWDALWIALAGGAIATVIAYVARFFAVPSEIAANDRAWESETRISINGSPTSTCS